ncbi:unnamed protein product [Schistosoma mattheei]|uniref:Uncharacterized protein n=1 Tax=Schistosoma mattheei TaxID=31246 RepID=A0A183Q8L9_9TREM|nr:unnamed protein product [Schistosoma mattheei]
MTENFIGHNELIVDRLIFNNANKLSSSDLHTNYGEFISIINKP